LENAFKFTPNEWSIEVTLDKKKLSIKDNGKWIPANDLEHIWKRFWQADRSKTDTKSFGLWLYLTKLLVEKHWWKIAMSSKVGKGTVCTISFA
jgi:signal transduction histidine kinase